MYHDALSSECQKCSQLNIMQNLNVFSYCGNKFDLLSYLHLEVLCMHKYMAAWQSSSV